MSLMPKSDATFKYKTEGVLQSGAADLTSKQDSNTKMNGIWMIKSILFNYLTEA